MNKSARLEMSYEEKITKYAMSVEKAIDVGFGKLGKTILSSCNGDI